MPVLLQRGIAQPGHDGRDDDLGDHVGAVVGHGPDRRRPAQLVGPHGFPDQHAAEEVAHKPAQEGDHDAHHDAPAAIGDHLVEAGREADQGEGHHIVQKDDADGRQRVGRVADVAQAQQHLDQAVHQRADDAHAGAVPVGDHHQRQHAAHRDAAAKGPRAFEVEQAQYRTDRDQDRTFHQLSQFPLIHEKYRLSYKTKPAAAG